MTLTDLNSEIAPFVRTISQLPSNISRMDIPAKKVLFVLDIFGFLDSNQYVFHHHGTHSSLSNRNLGKPQNKKFFSYWSDH